MCRAERIQLHGLQGLGVVIAALASAACGLIDLEELELDLKPAESGAVLAAGTPVELSFSLDVDHASAEQAVRLSGAGKSVATDPLWEGRTLRLTPVPALSPGTRYLLEVQGPIVAPDGRSFSARAAVSFYSGSAEAAPQLIASEPAEGAAVGIDQVLRFEFDRAMDQETFKSALSLSPASEWDATWDAAGRIVSLRPKTVWRGATWYAWSLGTGAKDSAGIALARERRGTFVTSADLDPPSIAAVGTALRSEALGLGQWSDGPVDLGTLRQGGAIAVTFSEALEAEAVGAAWKIQPTLRGHWQARDEADRRGWLWIADAAPEAGTDYTIEFAAGLKDPAGNATRTAWRQTFTAGPARARLLEVRLDRADGSAVYSITAFGTGAATATYAPREPDKLIVVTLHFSADIPSAKRQAVIDAIAVRRHWPSLAEVTSPDVTGVSFPDARSVSLVYEGFSVGSTATATQPAVRHWYKVEVTGGSTGPVFADGSWLEEGAWCLFATN